MAELVQGLTSSSLSEIKEEKKNKFNQLENHIKALSPDSQTLLNATKQQIK